MKGLGILLFLAIVASVEWNGGKIVRSDSDWLQILGQDRFRILRRKGTDPAYLGKYVHPSPVPGFYQCRLATAPFS